MFSYVLGFLGFLVLFYNPIVQMLSPSSSSASHRQMMIRTPRPPVNEDLLALEQPGAPANWTAPGCPPDAYSVHVYSREPLVLYIEGFLGLEERKHLLDIAEPLYEPSTTTSDGGATTERDRSARDSDVAVVPRDATVRCVEARARALQGWRDDVWLELLRVQRYRAGGHYSHHFDWSSSRGGWGRVSSFMVWVDDGGLLGGVGTGTGAGAVRRDGEEMLVGGGTEFPRLPRRKDERWCQFVECGEKTHEGREGGTEGEGEPQKKMADGPDGEPGLGVVFKTRPGNAVYWENFRADGTGRGYDEAWHAGLPVKEGVKVGLNIWSWGRLE